MSSVIEDLVRLNNLRIDGGITEEEFDYQKERLISKTKEVAVRGDKEQTAQTGDNEIEIFKLSPSWKAYFDKVFLYGVMLPVTIVSAVKLAFGLFLMPVFLMSVVPLIYMCVKTRSTHYQLTTHRLIVTNGLFSKQVQDIELYRVQDLHSAQSLLARMMGIGNVTIVSADNITPVITLIGVPDPLGIKETIRTYFRASRKREGARASEFFQS